MKTITELFLKEFDQEAETTRKMLACIPDDKYDWKPHEKSMTIRRLATHIADIPTWMDMAVYTDELNFANNDHKEPVINNTRELLSFLEDSLTKGRAALVAAKAEKLDEPWTMRNGEQIYVVCTRGELIRTSFNQITHHRAQMGVFLRLLNVPIPGSYGPSADEQGMF